MDTVQQLSGKRLMPKLDTVMNELSIDERQGPLTASLKSPFLASPIIASTLLLAAGKLAKGAEPDQNGSLSSPLVVNPVAFPSISDVMEAGVKVTQSKTLLEGQLKPIAVAAYEDLLFLVRIAKWKVAYSKGESFDRQEQLPYFGRFDEAQITTIFEGLITDIWPTVEGKPVPKEATRARELAKIIIAPESSVSEILGAIQKAFELLTKAVDRLEGAGYTSFDSSAEAKSDFSLEVKTTPDRLIITWDKSLGDTLLSAVGTVAQKLRDTETDPSFVDYLVFHVGYELLRSGAQLDSSEARWLGTPGFRTHTQTYVSLTDPGDGHIFGTTRKSRWLKGAICHVEHLERPGNLSRDDIESYRIPSIFEFARVRLHTGSAAPNTYFVGRRVKDSTSGNFAFDFIKVVNLTSAACSAAFQLGAAETKVAMDGLKASEAVAYMQALSGHVLRNRKQVLSCAWNLNTPLIDDLAEPDADGNEVVLHDQMDIGRRGIQLAILGGFDKATFDGAADSYPSKCIVLQLSVAQAMELIHLAHQAGLLTYMSAGFKLGGVHIANAVLSGVDGIGIGGAQILRYMDHTTGHQGPYTEEFIDSIDRERDEAANSIRGRGVHLLCRLDRMHFEGSITAEEEALRDPFFKVLQSGDEAEIQKYLDNPELKSILDLGDDGESPTSGNARRLLRAGKTPVLANSAEGGATGKKWIKFTKDLVALLQANSEDDLAQYYGSQPWSGFHEDYKKTITQVRHNRHYTIKAAPHS